VQYIRGERPCTPTPQLCSGLSWHVATVCPSGFGLSDEERAILKLSILSFLLDLPGVVDYFVCPLVAR